MAKDVEKFKEHLYSLLDWKSRQVIEQCSKEINLYDYKKKKDIVNKFTEVLISMYEELEEKQSFKSAETIIVRNDCLKVVAVGTIDIDTFKEEALKKAMINKGIRYDVYKKVAEFKED